MKKICILLLLSILFVGCASDWMIVRQNELEKKIEALEKGGIQSVRSPKIPTMGPIVDEDQLQKLAEKGGAVKLRAFTCTTGETSACLDNYSSALLADGDLAIVFNSANNLITFHKYDDSDATITQEFDPEYIFPNGRPGNEVWKLFSGFRYLPGTTDSLKLRDSNNTNIQEVIVNIEGNATATGDGSEDADLSVQVIGAGTLRDYMIFDGNAGVKLLYRSDETWIDDDQYTGIVLADYNAGEDISQWDLVYFDYSENEWMQADADEVSGGPNYPARGMAVKCGDDSWPCNNGDTLWVLIHGKVRNDSWDWTNSGEAGNLVLSNTAGGMTNYTSVTSSYFCEQPVGWAINNDTIFVSPQNNCLNLFYSNHTFYDGVGSSPAVIFKNEANQYGLMVLTESGGFHIDNTTGGGSYIGLYPGANGHVVVVPQTDGYGIYLCDVEQDNCVTLSLPDNTDHLSWGGDLLFADGKCILDASGTEVACVNDGGEWEWKGSQAGVGAVNLTSEGLFQVNGTSLSATTRTLTNHTYDGAVNTHKHEDGTNPTVDASGQIRIDTTKDQLLYYGGVQRVLVPEPDHCFTIKSPSESDDGIPIFRSEYGFTVTSMYCYAVGGTSAQIILTDGSNALDTMTCTASTGVDDDGTISNAQFSADEQMFYNTGTVTGTVTSLNFCFNIKYTRE